MLKDEEMIIDGVKFYFEKMPYYEGIEVFESIRYALRNDVNKLSHVLNSINTDDSASNPAFLAAIIGLIMSLSPQFVAETRAKMFKFVKFQRPKEEIDVLDGLEDAAFGGNFIASYEVLGRSLKINFIDPLLARLSQKIGVATPISSPQKAKT